MAQASKSAARPNVFARFRTYLHDVRTELRRVIWPSRPEVINSSIVVIITLIFFVLFTLAIDSVASYVFIDVIAGIGR
jgi:preprotein translocase subunit SecE